MRKEVELLKYHACFKANLMDKLVMMPALFPPFDFKSIHFDCPIRRFLEKV
jgi:hypothetical protein